MIVLFTFLIPLVNFIFNIFLIKFNKDNDFEWYNQLFFFCSLVICILLSLKILLENNVSAILYEFSLIVLSAILVISKYKLLPSYIQKNIKIILFMPIIEEIIFRFILISCLINYYEVNKLYSLVISALSFGIFHYFGGMKEVFIKSIIGVFIGGLYLLSNNLLLCLMLHMSFNYCVLKRNGGRS